MKIDKKQFTEYVWSFYGPKQINGDMFANNLTRKELNEAVSLLIETREFEGDSVDREAVRDIMLANRRRTPAKDTIKDVLKLLIETQIKKSFVPDYQAKATQEEAAGIMLSQYFEWDGLSLLMVARAALEDANFHSESRVIDEMIKKLEKQMEVA